MKKALALCVLIIIVSMVSNCDSDKKDSNKYLLLLLKTVFNGDTVWARSVNTGSSYTQITSIAVEKDSIYVAGIINGAGTYWFGAQSVAGKYSGENAVLVKYDKDGTALWARSVSAATSSSQFYSIAAANDGIYVAGVINNTGAFSFGNQTVTGVNSLNNAVLVKYDRDGNALWAKTVAAGSDYSLFRSVAILNDTIYVAGFINGTGAYWFGAQSVVGKYAGQNAVLVKYDKDGNALWARSVAAASNSSQFKSIAATNDGIYAAGLINGAGTFWFGNQSVTGVYSGNNGVLIKYDKDGTALWARAANAGSNFSRFESVSVSNDNLYVAGVIGGAGTFWFGHQSVAGKYSSLNAVLVKYDKDGTAHWARSVAAGTDYSGFDSVYASSEGIYTAGYLNGDRTFWFGDQSVVGKYSGSENAVLVKYDKDGIAHWARSVAAGNNSSGFNSLAVGSDGIYVGGYLAGAQTFWFGAQSVNGAYSGGNNALLVKYK